MIGIDRADELGCVGVPPGDGVCVAVLRRGKGRGAAGVIGQFPSNDAWLIAVAPDYSFYILVKLFPYLLVRVKFVMRLLFSTELLNIDIHTAYMVSS